MPESHSGTERTASLTPSGSTILGHLHAVAALRAALAQDEALSARLRQVKAWQHERFEASYQDMLASPRFGPAARFFLEDLYGPQDFTERDAQFARIVPALVRLFPADIVATVSSLSELHALSESLDVAMARALVETGAPCGLEASSYMHAWQMVGRERDRQRQIELMLQVGYALEGFTRKPLLRHSLRLMRGPAAAAGLSALQRFLETGFDTFRSMQGAETLLETIAQRERALCAGLFAGNTNLVLPGKRDKQP